MNITIGIIMTLKKSVFIMLILVFIITDSFKRNIVIDENITITDKKIYVLEKDEIFGGWSSVDNFHMTIIFNQEETPVTADIESPFPGNLNIKTGLSPSFGNWAIIPTDYARYFKVPSLYNYFHVDEPNFDKNNAHVWCNVVIPPDSGVLVPYSNYYGMGKDLFAKKLGYNQFLNLKILTIFEVKNIESDNQIFQVSIHEIMENTSKDTLFNVNLALHIPRILFLKSETEIELYTIQSENLSSNILKSAIFHWGRGDGFGHGTIDSPEITVLQDTLLPFNKIDFLYEMNIQCLQEKFEIYPWYLVFYETLGKRIWPSSKIKINSAFYNGHVDYLYKCNLSIPTYILLAIDKKKYKISDPDNITPTFYDPFY